MEIYAVRSNHIIDSYNFNILLNFLSDEEQHKINKYLRKEDSQRGLIGKVLIRSLVSNRYKIKNQDIDFGANKFGKPYYKLDKDFHFNISHSGQWVTCAVDNSSIGIDVERITDIDFSIAERFFSKEENRDLMKLDEKKKSGYFFDLWTLKESYIKAKGEGLSIALDSFSIRKTDKEIDINGSDRVYYFKQYDINDNYKFSVCAVNNNFPRNIKVMDLKEFIQYSTKSLGGNLNE